MESLDWIKFNIRENICSCIIGGSMKLSVAMITYNEEKILAKTLSSISLIADEIIIVDSGSTDRTEEIASCYGAKFIHQDWLGYGPQRNKAIELCKGEWILNIDADEEVSPKLLSQIEKIISQEDVKEVYKISFTTVCFGKKIYYGGWSNTKKIRLFKKKVGKFNQNKVHEEFETKEAAGILTGEIFHHTYLDLEDYFVKFNRYTTEGAKEAFIKKKKAKIWKIILEPIYKFTRMYIFRLGFLDGLEGFVLANTSAMYSMVKYYKLYELYKKEREK